MVGNVNNVNNAGNYINEISSFIDEEDLVELQEINPELIQLLPMWCVSFTVRSGGTINKFFDRRSDAEAMFFILDKAKSDKSKAQVEIGNQKMCIDGVDIEVLYFMDMLEDLFTRVKFKKWDTLYTEIFSSLVDKNKKVGFK